MTQEIKLKVGDKLKTVSGLDAEITRVKDNAYLFKVLGYGHEYATLGNGKFNHDGKPHVFDLDLSTLERKPEPETLDIGEMFIRIDRCGDGAIYTKSYTTTKEESLEYIDDEVTLAILKVKDWAACKRGERKLIVGEGLE